MAGEKVQHQVIGEALIIEINAAIDRDSVEPLSRALESAANGSAGDGAVKSVVMLFKGDPSIEIGALRKLTAPLKALKLASIKTVVLDMPSRLLTMFKEQGLDGLIHVVYREDLKRPSSKVEVSQSEAGVKSKSPAQSIRSKPTQLSDEHFLLLTQGLVKTFQFQCGLTLNSLAIKTQSEPRPYGRGIAGVARFTLDGAVGTVALCLPEVFFLEVLGKMFKREFKEIDPILKDTVAELLNVSLGLSRTLIIQKGFTYSNLIPSVVFPLESAKSLVSTPFTILPFRCSAGDTELELELEVGLDP